MTITSDFEPLARVITERLAELLCARIMVLDAEHTIVASSEPGLAGLPYELIGRGDAQPALRVPLRLASQGGEVIVGQPEHGDVLSPHLAQGLVELVINQTAAVERWPHQHGLKNRFIHQLLHGQVEDEATIVREGKLLGLDLTPPRAVILIDAADYLLADADPGTPEAADAQVRRRVQLIISSIVSFFHLPNDTICAYLGDGEVAVLKASNTQNLISWADGDAGQEPACASWANLLALKRAGSGLLHHLRANTSAALTLGIGRYHPGIRGLARSYQDARAALALGRRFHGQNGVHCLDNLGIAAFVGVADERTKVELATHVLSPLDHEPDLLETLAMFFAQDCCPSTTARQLAIHRNTLGYRLEKIALLSGLDPRRFDDAVQIRLALLLRSFSHD